MKEKNFLLFLVLLSLTFLGQSRAQLLEENFDYDAGELTVVASSVWFQATSTSTVPVEVVDGNLSYSSYLSSNIGRKIQLNGGATRQSIQTTFTTQGPANGSSVYVSFLLNVTSNADMDLSTSSGDYFANLRVVNSTAMRSVVFVRQGTDTKYQIGLGKLSSSTPVWYTSELDINITYLVVVSYVFQAGSDVVKLWINPDLSGSEPPENISMTSGSDAADGISDFQFRQNSKSGDMDIDGLRIADSWMSAPLPVELTSFTALVNGNAVRLDWETATEVNNYGFEIERKMEDGKRKMEWEKIGFVLGNGNSNSPKYYSFTDNPLGGREFKYRLKQIDIDGTYEYSNELSVTLENIVQYKLSQNYPNPFNPVTKINYTIAPPNLPKGEASQHVTLKVYDMLGREIATLVNEEKSTGNYKVEFDGSALYSGIYFYKLESGTYCEVKKFVLIK